jgi:hypothetical protein
MYTPTQHRQLVTRSVNYRFIVIQLYKLGANDILCHCALENELDSLLYEAHEGIVGGHNVVKATMHKVLCVGLWWPSMRHMSMCWKPLS